MTSASTTASVAAGLFFALPCRRWHRVAAASAPCPPPPASIYLSQSLRLSPASYQPPQHRQRRRPWPGVAMTALTRRTGRHRTSHLRLVRRRFPVGYVRATDGSVGVSRSLVRSKGTGGARSAEATAANRAPIPSLAKARRQPRFPPRLWDCRLGQAR